MKKATAVLLTLLVVLGLSLYGAGSAPVTAASVEPVFVAGNPSCVDLGYTNGFKVDPPNSGTYYIGTKKVDVTADGVYFDWTSEIGMDAVIAKGGPNANVYVYDPPAESFGDTGLVSPINPSNDKPFGLSHIEFCFDYELQVSKTAVTSYTRTFTWKIDKSVDPASHVGFAGDTFSSRYEVELDQTVDDSAFAVAGVITIHNPDPSNPALITAVTDAISDGLTASVTCPVTLPYSLAAGGTLTCTYTRDLPDKTARTNKAAVTVDAASKVKSGSATAPVTFGDPTTVVGYETVNVSDSVQGALGSASGDKTFAYDDDFECPTDPKDYADGKYEFEVPNTATIDETGKSDDAKVTVTCYQLKVSKDVTPKFTRTWSWTIDKSGDQTGLTLSTGQVFSVNYDVVVDATYLDSGWMVEGQIEVYNPAPIAAALKGVTDVIGAGISVNLDCGVTFPYSLAAGATLTCDYDADLPDGATRLNMAAATLGNGTSFVGTADITFGGPTTVIDECIDVTDDKKGVLGTVCAADAPKTFTYSLEVGPYAECGEYEYKNIASFVTDDTATAGSDSWTVQIDVPCEGCTLTPGYWKTHSSYGPAPYDDAWEVIGEDTIFFLSGKTYYQVLWTPPSGGNAYYILAHAYIAAKLNVLNGAASTSSVDAAITYAEAFFEVKTPAVKLSKAERDLALAYAALLDNYNNGLTGPGHCDW